jgi:type II secretory pathway pseudopilin PulG
VTPRRPPRAGGREAGYALVALVASVTVALIAMAVAVPAWRHVVKNEREQELIFRGGQIADAIARYQRKNANALPASLDQLVKGRYLRKAYKDPMTKDGEWRLVRQGEALLPGMAAPGTRPSPSPSPGSPTPRPPSGLGSGGTLPMGPFLGVASRSTDKGLRLFNGRERYNEWLFVVGQPRVVGRQSVVPQTPGGRQPAAPGQPVQPLQRPR